MSSPKYIAFISYAHADNVQKGQKWADWIKETIEQFPVPGDCVGKMTAQGEVPPKLPEVFLDRADLPAGGVLTTVLQESLDNARFLLLICSPRSALSHYVGLEVDHFVQTGRAAQVIPVVIDSDSDSGTEWVAGRLRKLGNEDELPLYVDFRVKEATAGRVSVVLPGWTDPSGYAERLKREKRYQAEEQQKLRAGYERDHRDARFKLLGALLGLRPRDLEDAATAEELHRKQQEILKQRKVIGLVACFGVLMSGLCAMAYHFYKIADRERSKAERSLRMIGDAHEGASRLVSDVLVELDGKLAPLGQEVLVEEARKIVEGYFDESEVPGDDAESRYMRSVTLNGRGYLALRSGKLDEAEEHFRKSLGLRQELLEPDPDKPMYLHALAVSHDNLGDVHAARAYRADASSEEAGLEFSKAAASFREGLAICMKLAAAPDAAPEWRHDLSVGHFKLGDILFEGGDKEAALGEFSRGLPLAQQVAACDPEYAKWSAHLALYHYAIGRIHAISGRDGEAMIHLGSAKTIFENLRGSGRMTSQYAKWEALLDLQRADLE